MTSFEEPFKFVPSTGRVKTVSALVCICSKNCICSRPAIHSTADTGEVTFLKAFFMDAS